MVKDLKAATRSKKDLKAVQGEMAHQSESHHQEVQLGQQRGVASLFALQEVPRQVVHHGKASDWANR